MATQPLPNGTEIEMQESGLNLTPESKSEVAEKVPEQVNNEKSAPETNDDLAGDEDQDAEMMDAPELQENSTEVVTSHSEKRESESGPNESEPPQLPVEKAGERSTPLLQPQIPRDKATPPTPPASFSEGQQLLPLAQGGIQWYMQPFDPIGTTIHEERWTGRELVRGMSEELSDIGDEELRDLAGDDDGVEDAPAEPPGQDIASTTAPEEEPSKSKSQKSRKRWRGFR